MPAEYTTAGAIAELAGQLALDLRTDDDDGPSLVTAAIAAATSRVDFYCGRYPMADLAASAWVNDVATFVAVRWLCMRRLNEVPASIEQEWEERREELELIRQGKAAVPRVAVSRRPGTVTNRTVDLRRFNNQTRQNGPMSTGAGSGYPRPTDPTAPDQR